MHSITARQPIVVLLNLIRLNRLYALFHFIIKSNLVYNNVTYIYLPNIRTPHPLDLCAYGIAPPNIHTPHPLCACVYGIALKQKLCSIVYFAWLTLYCRLHILNGCAELC